LGNVGSGDQGVQGSRSPRRKGGAGHSIGRHRCEDWGWGRKGSRRGRHGSRHRGSGS
jgi:hypothetical protein